MSRLLNSLGVESLTDLEERIRDLVADPSTSNWLRSALVHLLQRDPVDACNDIRCLDEVATARVLLIEQHAQQSQRASER